MTVTRTYDCGCIAQQDPDASVLLRYCSKHEAAPDLYEACKDSLGMIRQLTPSDLVEKAAKDTAISILGKALAKVEGK